MLCIGYKLKIRNNVQKKTSKNRAPKQIERHRQAPLREMALQIITDDKTNEPIKTKSLKKRKHQNVTQFQHLEKNMFQHGSESSIEDTIATPNLNTMPFSEGSAVGKKEKILGFSDDMLTFETLQSSEIDSTPTPSPGI